MPQTFVLPKQVAVLDGAVAPNTVAEFFQTATSTPQAVYTDAALTNAVTSITADAAGVFGKVYLNPNAAANYRVVITPPGGTPYTEDDIDRLPASQAAIGAALYPLDDGESAAAVTPVNKAYPAGHVLRYAANTTPGTTDMTVAFQRAALSSLNPYAPPGQYLITGSIPLRDNQHWTLDGARISITGTSIEVFTAAAGIDGWSIDGDWTITGDNGSTGATSGSACGVKITDSQHWRVSNGTFVNIKGWGIRVLPGSSTSARAEHGQILSPQVYGCYRGIEVEAGTGAEYVLVDNPIMSRCNRAMRVAAGNYQVMGGSLTDNTDAVDLQPGANHLHGSFVGTYLNHNTDYVVRADGGVTINGHYFVGCQIYEGDIYLKKALGVKFKSCVIDVANHYFEGSQGCGFTDCTLPDGYANTINNSFNADPSYTIWEGCKKLTGKNDNGTFGNIRGLRVQASSAGIAISVATLAAETTLLLTDAANYSANDNAQTLFDGYAAGTGIFTCRGLGDGRVSVDILLNITTNAADAGLPSAYGYLAKNGTTFHRWMTKTRISTTKTIISFSGIVEMDDGDTLRIRLGGTVANDITVAASETVVIVEGL